MTTPIAAYAGIFATRIHEYFGDSINDGWKEYIARSINIACNNTVALRIAREPDVPQDAIVTYVYNEYLSAMSLRTMQPVVLQDNPATAMQSVVKQQVVKQQTTCPFLEQFRNPSFDATTIIDLSTTDLFPDLNRDEMLEINMRKDQKVEKRHTNLYKCRRCGKRETVAQQIYIKMKADEAVSFDVECVSCGNKWIVN